MNLKVKKETINYLIFWFGQAVSQLGSSLTGYALTIWAYQTTGHAMTLSLMIFCTYLPRILASLVSGSFVDRYSKKAIMLLADSAAACCTLIILYCCIEESLSVSIIYGVNIMIGLMNAFQGPASSVAVGMLVPEGQYERASGLNSFTNNLITVASPMLAGLLFTIGGLSVILTIDLASFLFAAGTLVFLVRFPERQKKTKEKPENPFLGFKEGIHFLIARRSLLYLMLVMAMINFFSRLTYENILPAMILARSNSTSAYGIVSGIIGAGGIIGGLLVTLKGKQKSPVDQIFGSVILSFLAGDELLALGRSLPVWCIAGLAASVPIPFIMAGQHAIIYKTVPNDMQGRIFSVQSIVQYSSIPVGILLGGVLADYVLEPFMASGHKLALILQKLVGSGTGSGMAVMFLGTGVFGALMGIFGYRSKEIRKLDHI